METSYMYEPLQRLIVKDEDGRVVDVIIFD